MELTTIAETQKSIDKLMNEPDPPLRLHPRESYPEIKAPLAQTMKDLALSVVEKRNNASEWKNPSSSQGNVYDDRDGGVSQRINGLEINVVQRSDSSVSINIFDEALSDASLYKNIPATDRDCEFQLVDINSRGEVVSFLPSHSIYERMVMDKEEFAHLVLTRLEGMADKIDRQVAVEQEIPLVLDSVPTVNEKVLEQEPPAALKAQDLWVESLRSQIGDVDGSKLQIFSGASKVYERNNNEVVLDKLEDKIGQKVQQAIENPSQLKGSVRVVVDGENIFHAKNGELLNNTYVLALENTQATPEKSLDVVPEIPQVDSVQVDDVQQANLDVALESPQAKAIEVQEQSIQVTQEESLDTALEIPEVIEVQQETTEIAQVESLDVVPEISQSQQVVEPEIQSVQAALSPPEPQQKPSQKGEAKVSFAPPQEIVVPVKNQQDSTQRVQLSNSEAREKAIFNLIARQETRINLLEQKLAAQSQPLSCRVNQWLEKINQTTKVAVKEVKEKSLHIPQGVRQFLSNKSNQIGSSIREQVNTARTQIANKVNERVTAVKSEVVSKVNEVKSSLERKLADVAGTSLNASTRYLAERFGVDNGAGIKVFQGNSLVITSSKEHSGIYAKDGKQLVKDGQFIAPVTKEQLSKIAQVQPEAQKLSQSESAVRAKALR